MTHHKPQTDTAIFDRLVQREPEGSAVRDLSVRLDLKESGGRYHHHVTRLQKFVASVKRAWKRMEP
jgi:hypothetical protein